MLIAVIVLALALDFAAMMAVGQWRRISVLQRRCWELEFQRQEQELSADLDAWARRPGS